LRVPRVDRWITNNIFINNNYGIIVHGPYSEGGDVSEIIGESVHIDYNCMWNNECDFLGVFTYLP